jgi:hypothetical protein
LESINMNHCSESNINCVPSCSNPSIYILLRICLILEVADLFELHDVSLLCARVLLDSKVMRIILEQLRSVQREKWETTPLILELGTLIDFRFPENV